MKNYHKWLICFSALLLFGALLVFKRIISEPSQKDKIADNELFDSGSTNNKESNKFSGSNIGIANMLSKPDPGIAQQINNGKSATIRSDKASLKNKEKRDADFEEKEKHKSGYDEADKPDMFTQYFKDITTRIGEQKSGYKMNYKAIELAKARQSVKNSLKYSETLNWIQRGPANVGGRTRALVVDPDDNTNNTWFAGAVSGGMWKTTNGGAIWQILSDEITNISSMAMANSNHNVLYAGTGESFPGGTYMVGNGIWKSKDRGVNWVQLSSTATNTDFEYVNRLIVDPANENIVLAATESGILKSTNGGATWVKVYLSRNGVEDLVADPTSFNTLFGCEYSIGVLRSTNTGNNWSVSNTGLEAGTRFEIAVSPVNHNNVFLSGDISSTASKVYISNDNGLSWKRFNNSQNFLGGQGEYDNAIAAHPYIADEVYVGGVDIWKLKFSGSLSTSAPLITNCYPVNTSFLTFVNFEGDFLGGGMSSTEGTNVSSDLWLPVEIRFGPGLKQKAHRFVVPDNATSGVPAANYTYADYVDVPFQVWDVKNNRKLMVSFRDQEKDGTFNLYPRASSDAYGKLGREYIYVHSIAYDSAVPNPNIVASTTGGHLYKTLYMFWPGLEPGEIWTPDNLPLSKIVVDYGTVTLYSGVKTSVADAYYNYNGPNNYDQNVGIGRTVIPGLHPDHHNITILPLGNGNFKMIEANDGGLAVSDDNGVTITQVPTNYITTQFYGVAKHPTANEYIGGMQDNGTWRSPSNENASGSSRYLFQISGDGFECLWHPTKPQNILGSLYNNAIKRTSDGGKTWVKSTGITADDGPFITRLSASRENPDLVFAVSNTGVYRSLNFGLTFANKSVSKNWSINNKVSSSHHVEVSLANGNIVWAGGGMAKSSGLQMQVSTDQGLTFSPIEDYSVVAMNTFISGLATHPTEDSTAYFLFSVRGAPKVLRTKDLGKSWEDISGFGTNSQSSNGFPDVIVHSLLVMPYNPDIIWVGTDIGIFESTDNGLSWHIATNGLPPVSVYQMKISGDQVVVATHGRGIWTVNIPEINKAPFISAFTQVEALNLSLTSNLKVDYDSVEIYTDGTKYSVVAGTTIGENVFPVSVTSDGAHVAYINGFIDGVAYKSNTININFTSSSFGVDLISETNRTELYPNPATDIVRFDLNAKYKKYKIEIFTLSGQKLLSLENTNEVNNIVNVGFLPGGTYLVNLYFDDKKATKKLIIKK